MKFGLNFNYSAYNTQPLLDVLNQGNYRLRKKQLKRVDTVCFRLRRGKEFTIERVFYCPRARMNLLTNQNLSPEFSFVVTPTKTTAVYREVRQFEPGSCELRKALPWRQSSRTLTDSFSKNPQFTTAGLALEPNPILSN